jgi:hypothetical protein
VDEARRLAVRDDLAHRRRRHRLAAEQQHLERSEARGRDLRDAVEQRRGDEHHADAVARELPLQALGESTCRWRRARAGRR